MQNDVFPSWMRWNYFEQGTDSCSITVLNFPGFDYKGSSTWKAPANCKDETSMFYDLL